MIALVLALIITPTILSAVVSIAKEPPQAIAGQRATDTAVAATLPERRAKATPAAEPHAVVLAKQGR